MAPASGRASPLSLRRGDSLRGPGGGWPHTAIDGYLGGGWLRPRCGGRRRHDVSHGSLWAARPGMLARHHRIKYNFDLSSRDSRFSRLGTGAEFISESESVSKSRLEKSRNRSRNRNSDIPSLGIGTVIESQTFQVSEPELELKFSVSRIFPLISTPVLV